MADLPTLELFDCVRTSCRLTAAGCSRLWVSANLSRTRHRPGSAVAIEGTGRPQAWEGRSACRGCPVGCKNAGRSDNPPDRALADLMRTRCDATGAHVNRLVAGAHGHFDVGAYNRRMEALRGRNARGTRPRLCDQLHRETWAVVDGDAVAVKTFASVVSPFEVLLRLARGASGDVVAIGRAAVALPEIAAP